jgi:putative nucleotidyltransferase with HDIG domain
MDAYSAIHSDVAPPERNSARWSESQTAERIFGITGDLPPMPHIAALVMERLYDDQSTPTGIYQLIMKDQALAASVLRVANSPYYGASRTISTLRDAVMFMGFDSIRSLIMTAVLRGVYLSAGFSEHLLWEHALACGIASRKIADEAGLQSREQAYLAGLMHDVGKAVLFQRSPALMREIMQEVYNEGSDFFKVEQQKLGFTHAEVGGIIAGKWHFPIDLEEAIGNHHTPGLSNSALELAHIVNLANLICHKLSVGPTRKPDLDLDQSESAGAVGLGPASIEKILVSVSEALQVENSAEA